MIQAQWQRARQEWRQSRRLRLGTLVVLLVLGLHAAMSLSDRRGAVVEEYVRDARLLQRLEDASRESLWPQRAEQAQTALTGLRDTLPQVASSGLAQAELQAWLTQQAQVAGLQDPRVRVETTLEVPDRPELWQVLARLDATVPDGTLAPFLRALSLGLPWIQAERLEVTEGRDTRLTLVARGYYRRPDAVGGEPVPGEPVVDAAAAAAAPATSAGSGQ